MFHPTSPVQVPVVQVKVITPPGAALNVVASAEPATVKSSTTITPSTRISTVLPDHPSPYESVPLKLKVSKGRLASSIVPLKVDVLPSQCSTSS